MGAPAPLGDYLALKLQELRSQQSEQRSLLRIDNRAQTAQAPFQFDAAEARLHRKGCAAIPRNSRTALYGLWQIPPHAFELTCPVCRPEANEVSEVAGEGASDYIYGVLSVLDQFGGVIRERGREFRESEEGQQLKAGLERVYQGLEDRERATLKVVLTSLDGLLATLKDIDESLDATPNGNGAPGSGNGVAPERNGHARRAAAPDPSRLTAEVEEP